MRAVKSILIIVFSFLWGGAGAQNGAPPKCEYRAVWLTAIENLDWPRVQVKAPADTLVQQRELLFLLDSLQSLNVNTVLLQTRVRGDVNYPSAIEPFSHVFTGVEGRSPGYDPLAFAIRECHRRNMQLHAWVVAFPLGKDEHIKRMGHLSLTRKKPALCTHYKGNWYMEPGNSATADYLCRIVEEIVLRYEVDGLHLDYIRYPDRTVGYPDGALFRKHGKGLSLADWRRRNVTQTARKVYNAVKAIKPWVRVSCAPLGKYDDLACYSSYGWNARNTVFQEAQEWLREGVMDILFPMLYFKGNNFYPFVLDWQQNSHGRHIVPGIGVYRLLPEYGGWPAAEIMRQLRTSRSAGTAGTALFRAAHIFENAGGAAEIYASVYKKKALIPPMEWAAEPLLSAPAALSVNCVRDTLHLVWSSVAAAEGRPVVRYNVYFALSDSVDVNDVENLYCANVRDTVCAIPCRTPKARSVAVVAVDAYGRESLPVRSTLRAVCEPLQELSLPRIVASGATLVLSDVYGREIFRGRYSTRAIVRGLPAGIYCLRAVGRDGKVLWSRNFKK